MKLRKRYRADQRLKERQQDYERNTPGLKIAPRGTFARPGSQNPHKGRCGSTRRK